MFDLIYVGLILVSFVMVAAFVYVCETLLAASTDRSHSTVVTTRLRKDD